MKMFRKKILETTVFALGLIIFTACGGSSEDTTVPISTIETETERQTPTCTIKEGREKTDKRITVQVVCKDGDINIDSANVTLDGVIKNLEYSGVSINDYIGFGNLNADTTYVATYTVIVGGESLEGSIDIRTKQATVVTSSSITHNGTTYGFITSPHTGKVWLDRHLGASQVCVSAVDAICYGDYYQWGRNANGHESRVTTTPTLAVDVESTGNINFITTAAAPNDWVLPAVDNLGTLRSANMSRTDGSFVCPVGFRVPTIGEIHAELTDAGSALISNRIDAFNSFLKLPSNGHRLRNGTMTAVNTQGYLWASDSVVIVNGAEGFSFTSISASNSSENRSFGRAIRCIQN